MHWVRVHAILILSFLSLPGIAADKVATASGNWNNASIWTPAGVPAAGDNVTIASGVNVAMNANPGNCNNLTVVGGFGCNNARTLNVGGNLILNSGASLNGGTGILNVTGTLYVPASATVTIDAIGLTVAGAATIDGSVTLGNVSGAKSFGALTISSTGSWNATVAEAISVNGALSVNNSFNAQSGFYTVAGTADFGAGNANFEGSIGGDLNVASGATVSINTGNCTVSGTTSIYGSINFSTATGSKSFRNIIVGASGVWNASVAENVTVTGNITSSGTFNCQSGTITLSGNVDVLAGTMNYEGSIGGTLTIASGATFNSPFGIITVVGATTVSGTLTISTATSTKSFQHVTINSGGSWNCTVAENITISGDLACNGSFTSNSGVYTFSGASRTFSGAMTINFVTVTGTYTNNATFTVPTALGGGGTLTQGVNSTLYLGGTFTTTNFNATTNTPNLVCYNGAGVQTIRAVNYYNLEVAKTGGSVGAFGGNSTVNNNLTVTSGVAAMGANTFIVLGSTDLTGELRITSTTGSKTFNDVNVQAAGTWSCTVGENIRIDGNLSNSGIFTANTGTYQLAGSGKTISGTLSVPTTSVTGTYTNNATYTSTTSLGGAGTFSQGATGILNMATSSFAVTAFNASSAGNTVNYTLAGAQNIRIPTDGSYHHLGIAGSGNKNLVAATDVNGDLTISGTLVANNFNLNVGGNWSSSGTFTPGSNTVTFDGAGQSISRTGGETFQHVVFSGSGTKTLGSDMTCTGNLTIQSALDVSSSNYAVNVQGGWTNNGSFIRNSGTVTLNGSGAQSIGGTAVTSFYNLTQSNASGVSLAQSADLYGALTLSSGTFTSTGYNFTLKSDASGTARIATIPGGADFTGNIIMERYTGTGPTDWRFLCSNVSGATIADWADDFATSGFTGATCGPADCLVPGCAATCNVPSIYWYDETPGGNLDTFGFMAATNVSDPIVSGRGYWVYLGTNPITYEVTGPPYKFGQSPTVTYSSSGSIANDGWNLISNPYPSAIDWDAAGWTKTNVDNAIYIYNSSTGSYAAYVFGMGVNGGAQYIASSQAFWVKSNASSPGVSLTENVKASPDPSFLKQPRKPNTSYVPMAFKDFPIPQNSNPVPNSLKLTAMNLAGREDELFIRFDPSAASGFDPGLDAWKLAHLDPALPALSAWVSDSSGLCIASYPSLTNDTSILLTFRVQVSGTYSIRRDSILMLPMSSCVLLEDLVTGQVTDLRSVVSYSFAISDTTKSPRFKLRLTAPILKQAIHPVCTDDSTGMAVVCGTGSGPWDYIWKDSLGNVLQARIGRSGPDTLAGLAGGLYFVEVTHPECGWVKDTVQIRSTSTFNATLIQTGISCSGMSDGAAQVMTAGGLPPYMFSWSTGASTSAVQNLGPGTYSVSVMDGAGCKESFIMTLQQPALLNAGFAASDTLDLTFSNSVAFSNISSGANAYLWDFGDGSPVDTTPQPVHYYSTVGQYITTLVALQTSCSDTVQKGIVVIQSNPFNVQETGSEDEITIYSNGQGIMLYVGVDKPQNVRVRVFNPLGSVLFEHTYLHQGQGVLVLPVSSLPSGIYLVEVEAERLRVADKAFLR